MEATVVLPIGDAYDAETRHGDICPSCLAADLTVVEVQLVRLTDEQAEDIGRYTAIECGTCGAEEVTR